jgi:quercetin dioxygenase-like cupin family protein
MNPVRVLEIINFDRPSEVHTFAKGKLEIVQIAGMVVGRATYEPGWRWSEHVGKKTGADLCEVEHLCVVIAGKSGLRMRDGTERTLVAGDVFAVPPGHDSWVVGDEPYVSLHILGADEYGAKT